MRTAAALAVITFAALAADPAFEVASIKVSTYDSNGMSGYVGIRPGGSLSLRNVTLQFLVGMAYSTPGYALAGGPNWIDKLRFHVDAKPAQQVSTDIARQMMQNMLVDRFHLQMHHETRMVDGYVVSAPKGDSKMEKLDPGHAMGFGFQQAGRIQGPGNMKMLIGTLSGSLGVPVRNETGLTGLYNIDLEWNINDQVDDGKPSMFAAFSERLGLVLKREKVPIDVLVIDSAEKPADN